ncbi:protein of unknown function DUF606 [Parasphaerochaeta coccoides DSM 17374]|uniref:EamA domain-containing protein n=2 Tax=Parasphaerochaeta TaxID=3062336 RepID=F4GH44_PARC1|nr:protein of unknown function DUF606 [Parasphaerochaeta coccoides DSM 17374]
MRTLVYSCIAFLVGMIISVMVILNTCFGEASTMGASMLANQMTGIVLLTVMMRLIPRKAGINAPMRGEHAPWGLWFGGIIGLTILIINFVTIVRIGTTMAMASAVFGQSVMSLVIDATGFLGMPKRRMERREILPLAVSATGIVIMTAAGGSFAISWMLLSMLAGVLTMAQMVYNSLFASYKGALFSARNNVVSGVAASIVWFAITDFTPTFTALTRFTSYPLWLSLGGGTLAVVVVVSMNIIIPRIPSIYSALLLSSGQIIMSVILDAALYELFSPYLLTGALLIIVGMVINLWQDLGKNRKSGIPRT